MSEAVPCISNTRLVWRAGPGFFRTAKSPHQNSVLLGTHTHLAEQTGAVTKLGAAAAGAQVGTFTWDISRLPKSSTGKADTDTQYFVQQPLASTILAC